MKKQILDITPDPYPESLTLDKLRAAVRLIEDLERGITEENNFTKAKEVNPFLEPLHASSFRCIRIAES